MLFNKMFFKLYMYVGNVRILDRIIALPSFPPNDLVDYMDSLHEDGFSLIPTTREAFIEYSMYRNMGNENQFEDILTENIRC